MKTHTRLGFSFGQTKVKTSSWQTTITSAQREQLHGITPGILECIQIGLLVDFIFLSNIFEGKVSKSAVRHYVKASSSLFRPIWDPEKIACIIIPLS